MPLTLARQLRRVPVGADVHIAFVGETPTKKAGGTVKLFSVRVPPDVTLLESEDVPLGESEDASF